MSLVALSVLHADVRCQMSDVRWSDVTSRNIWPLSWLYCTACTYGTSTQNGYPASEPASQHTINCVDYDISQEGSDLGKLVKLGIT